MRQFEPSFRLDRAGSLPRISFQATGFRRTLGRIVAVLAGVALLAGCGSGQRRVAVPVPTDSPPVAISHPPGETEEQTPDQDLQTQRKMAENRVKERLRASRTLYLEGESLFNQGKRDEGGEFFRRALGQLAGREEESDLNRQLEQAYYALLVRIEDLRLEDLDSDREEDSPIEWLANRNVFTIRVDPKLKHLASEDLLTSHFDSTLR